MKTDPGRAATPFLVPFGLPLPKGRQRETDATSGGRERVRQRNLSTTRVTEVGRETTDDD